VSTKQDKLAAAQGVGTHLPIPRQRAYTPSLQLGPINDVGGRPHLSGQESEYHLSGVVVVVE